MSTGSMRTASTWQDREGRSTYSKTSALTNEVTSGRPPALATRSISAGFRVEGVAGSSWLFIYIIAKTCGAKIDLIVPPLPGMIQPTD